MYKSFPRKFVFNTLFGAPKYASPAPRCLLCGQRALGQLTKALQERFVLDTLFAAPKPFSVLSLFLRRFEYCLQGVGGIWDHFITSYDVHMHRQIDSQRLRQEMSRSPNAHHSVARDVPGERVTHSRRYISSEFKRAVSWWV